MKLPTLEEQVCTLEQAAKISELGVVIDTFFYWFDNPGDGWRLCDYESIPLRDLGDRRCAHYPAPNVAELGAMLPAEYENRNLNVDITKESEDVFLLLIYELDQEGPNTMHNREFKTEASARAEAYIYLKENGHLDHPTEC